MSSLKNLVKRLLGPPLSSVVWYAQEAMSYAEMRALMKRLGHCELDLALSPPWDIRGEQHVFIGSDVYIGPRVLMMATPDSEIHIGDHVMCGPQVSLIANDHRFDDPARLIKHAGYRPGGGIWVGHDVWIGACAIVLKGVTIGDGAVIGAGSVVTRNVNGGEIWAGNPARLIRSRFPVAQSR